MTTRLAACNRHPLDAVDACPLVAGPRYGVPAAHAAMIATGPFESLVSATAAECEPCTVAVARALATDPAQVLYAVLESALRWQYNATGSVLDGCDTACLSRPYRHIVQSAIASRAPGGETFGAWEAVTLLTDAQRTDVLITSAAVAVEAVAL